MRSFLVALGLLVVAATAQPAGYARLPAGLAAASEPQAPALPPASTRAPAMRTAGWIQREGYVPVPDSLVKPAATPGADPNALPPANQWATIDLDKPFADDPLGTNVYADAKYAPANVRAAIENKDEDPTGAVWAKPPPSSGIGIGGMSMGAGSSRGGDSATMLQQSYGPSAPTGAASETVFAPGAGPVGGAGAAAGMGAGAGAGAGAASGDNVFTGGSNGFNNKYQASVANAMGSSDLMVSMIIDAPEQTVALGSDVIRQLMGQRTNTMPGKIFVYSTRTINNPKGQPSTSITYLIKNNLDVERSRQAGTFGSIDQNNGLIRDVAKATKLQIAPGSIKVSGAVNDGGMNAPAAPGAGLPGQLPGQMPGQMMPGAAGAMGMPGMTAAGAPAAAAAPAPAAPAKSGASHAVAGVLTAAAVLFAAVLVF